MAYLTLLLQLLNFEKAIYMSVAVLSKLVANSELLH